MQILCYIHFWGYYGDFINTGATTINLTSWLLAVREEVGSISYWNNNDFGNARSCEVPIGDIEISLALGHHGDHKFGLNAHHFSQLSFACVCFSVSENASSTPVAPHLPAPTRNNLIIRLYQINTDKCTKVLLSHQFIRATGHPKMFQPSKSHLHGIFNTLQQHVQDYE
jgi:hypothetical protein